MRHVTCKTNNQDCQCHETHGQVLECHCKCHPAHFNPLILCAAYGCEKQAHKMYYLCNYGSHGVFIEEKTAKTVNDLPAPTMLS